MYHNTEELIDLTAKLLNPYELLDILGMDMVDLTRKLKDEIEESAEEIERALRQRTSGEQEVYSKSKRSRGS